MGLSRVVAVVRRHRVKPSAAPSIPVHRSVDDERVDNVRLGNAHAMSLSFGQDKGPMAPEQLLGAEADARSDIFAFGILLYELLAGVHPFTSRRQETGDRRQETGDRRQETGDRRQEITGREQFSPSSSGKGPG